MRRKAILSLTVMWLILGTISLAQSREQAALPPASLQAIALTGPAPSHQLLLRIEGAYNTPMPRGGRWSACRST
jgi:hypothetical protein